MEKVVFITGASSGIGRETAKLFQTKNWKVAATMRSPEKAEDLGRIADIECFRLDVTEPDTIRSAFSQALERFGKIDAIVNNAGYGLLGPFEAASVEQIRRQFETNVFGLMDVCRHVIPYFREQGRGTIVNIASIGGRTVFPFSSLYCSTKWAVEGFSESLLYELEPFNIREKVIEPGPIKTDFYSRSYDLPSGSERGLYEPVFSKFKEFMFKGGDQAPDGSAVAEVVYNAVTDGTARLRYGVNTKGLLTLRRLLPEALYRTLTKKIFLK